MSAASDGSPDTGTRDNDVRPLRVWDLPTRAFHWVLAACIVGSLVSVTIGGNAIGWHFRFGYAILTLLLFRLMWGFVGPRYARFSSFPPNPLASLRYLRGRSGDNPGHSPLGALSVYAMLAALAVQVGTGLFANDDIMWEGPLRALVSNDLGDRLTAVHRINRVLVIALVALHLLAIAWYTLIRGNPLVRAMIFGDKPVPRSGRTDAAADGARERLLALALFLLAATTVWAVVTQLG